MTTKEQLQKEIQEIVDRHGECVDFQGWGISEPERSEATLKLLAIIERETAEIDRKLKIAEEKLESHARLLGMH